jgi:hypothetical protein
MKYKDFNIILFIVSTIAIAAFLMIIGLTNAQTNYQRVIVIILIGIYFKVSIIEGKIKDK